MGSYGIITEKALKRLGSYGNHNLELLIRLSCDNNFELLIRLSSYCSRSCKKFQGAKNYKLLAGN
jgi:hypothetical protein